MTEMQAHRGHWWPLPAFLKPATYRDHSPAVSLSIGLCAIFSGETSLSVMIAVIFVGGVFRALQLTSLNALVFAEVTNTEMSHATALSQMALRVSQGGGGAATAALLHFYSGDAGQLTNAAFSASFIVIVIVRRPTKGSASDTVCRLSDKGACRHCDIVSPGQAINSDKQLKQKD